MKKIYVRSIGLSLITFIIMACASDEEIRVLYEARPCPQQIVMNSNASCIQSNSRPITPAKGFYLETKLAFEKKDTVDCPKNISLTSFKWEPAVYFDYKKHDLTPIALKKIQQNILLLNSQTSCHISVRGFTDNRGNHDYNQRLANRRALSVLYFLMTHGIKKDRILLAPVGETAPLLPNNTEENMAINRRVEMLLLNHDGEPVPYVVLTPDIQVLLNQKISQKKFCQIWNNRIQWFPGIFFKSEHIDLNKNEMDKVSQNVQVLKNHSDFMLSIREFSSSNLPEKQKDYLANQRIKYLENYLYSHQINKKRVQIISPEETRIFQTQMSRHHSSQTPCVEMLLLDHKARPIPLIVFVTLL
ncbi:secreted protein containing Outer membrane protein, OmpA/MotB [Candidatus Magnetomorum sp. HK-1]|nr:secreted protein containing Outer membrane protein, OmpA/MotB [Candidatus Magnetomorum sp. HK-1]